ncbi:MAG: hypothetical protein K8R53_10415, partial [Bacteroidales bacterium]|nr:hypothetical protein [Bacteroidales bacterium]
GKDCRQILKMFFAKHSLKEIAAVMGFSSTDYAKFRKYQCKEMLKKKILNDPYSKSLFVYG